MIAVDYGCVTESNKILTHFNSFFLFVLCVGVLFFFVGERERGLNGD